MKTLFGAAFLVSTALLIQPAKGADYIIQSQKDVDALGANGGTKNFNKRMIITKSGVYNFHGTLFYWNGKGKCGQPENQPYIMRISASNVTVQNFGYKNAPDGIHIGSADDGQGYRYGNKITGTVLDTVEGWACEDAMTTQYGVQDVLIKNSNFHGNPNYASADKILQLNFGNVSIENSTFEKSRVCVMFKGTQTMSIKNSSFDACERGVVGETIGGILGKIGTGPSVLTSQTNQANQRSSGYNYRYFLVANDSKITIHSSGDQVINGGKCKANSGGVCDVR